MSKKTERQRFSSSCFESEREFAAEGLLGGGDRKVHQKFSLKIVKRRGG